MADGTRSLRGGSPASSPLLGGRGRAAAAAAAASSSPGHSFRRVTLTKPTFCHYCTDFIWGLAGYQCEGKGMAGGGRAGGRAAGGGVGGRQAGRRAAVLAGAGAGRAGPAGNDRRVLGEMGGRGAGNRRN